MKNSHMISGNDRTRKSDGRMKEKMSSGLVDIKNYWLRIVLEDPFLPRSLLPKPWYGYEAEKLVKG